MATNKTTAQRSHKQASTVKVGINWPELEARIVALESDALALWILVVADFTKNGAGNRSEYARKLAALGSSFEETTIGQNIGHIVWANENRKGGADAFHSISAIREERYAKNKATTKAETKTKKPTAFTTKQVRALKAEGFSARDIKAIARALNA